MPKPDIEKVSLRIEAIWTDAENRIIQDIVRRIKQYKKITSTADYQINRLIDLGKSTEEIERILKESLNATYPEMYKLYDDVANWQYVRNKDLYEQVNAEFIPPEENEWLIQLSEAVKKQTNKPVDTANLPVQKAELEYEVSLELAEIYQIELLTKSNEERRREPLEYYKL